MISLNFHKQLLAGGGKLSLAVNCKIDKGDFVAVYGPSGAGKTTFLRIVAGLINPDKGHIIVGGTPWYNKEKAVNIKPQDRSTGLVFQDYALFPNMTIAENIQYAKHNTDNLVYKEVIELMELGDILARKPSTLSGGQQQRAALARSIVSMPEILMLDEPMAALDLKMRANIQEYLLAVHKKFNLTTILVSHDVGEIFKLANRVFMMEEGRIIKEGSPADLFASKYTSGKFQFVGEVLNIQQEDVIFILTILIGNKLVKVVAEEAGIKNLAVGDKVMVASKAFNPVIQKII